MEMAIPDKAKTQKKLLRSKQPQEGCERLAEKSELPDEDKNKRIQNKGKEPVKSGSKKKVAVVAFTPSALNNQIVLMRKILLNVMQKITQKLHKQVKQWEIRYERQKDKEKALRKIARLKEEYEASKKISKDEVSKFALTNDLSFGSLIKKEKTTTSQIVLYRLATHPLIIETVKQFRVRHPGSEAGIAFALQRLGLQYQGARAGKTVKRGEESKEEDEVDGTLVIDEKVQDEGEEVKDDLKKISVPKKSKKEVTKKKKGEKEVETRVEVKAIKKIQTANKEAVVKRIKLHVGSNGEDDEEEIETENEMKEDMKEDEDDVILSSFFLNPDGSKRSKEEKEKSEYQEEEIEAKKKRSRNVTVRQDSHGRSIGGGRMESTKGKISNVANEEKLHPSWIAKQKMKELQQAKPSGKKIVFDA